MVSVLTSAQFPPLQSFISYARSVFLQRDKTVFDVNALPLDDFALSLGLAKAPKIRFVQKQSKKFGTGGADSVTKDKEVMSGSRGVAASSSDEDSGDESEGGAPEKTEAVWCFPFCCLLSSIAE